MKREFLFGSSSVVAALKAGRRQLYRLHLSKENNASSREGGRLIDAKDDAKRYFDSCHFLSRLPVIFTVLIATESLRI